MAKKADLEAAHLSTVVSLENHHRAVADTDYASVVGIAAAGLIDVWPAVAYQRRYLGIERPELSVVDALLRYAPLVFARKATDQTHDWWATA